VGSTGVLQKCKIQICHGEYINILTMKRKAIGSVKSVRIMLHNLSEHQIEALSNLLRGNDCFISQPTGLGKSAVYQSQTISLYFLSLLYEAFELL
jgi:superfamily II DNA or RNA helicase